MNFTKKLLVTAVCSSMLSPVWAFDWGNITTPQRPQPDSTTPERPQPDASVPNRPVPDFGGPERPQPGGDAAHIHNNAMGIASLNAQFNQMTKEFNDKLDQTHAALHATVNARPVANEGEWAMGVGMGFSGSTEALAFGVAHHFKDTGFSVSGTFNYASGTSNVNSDTSGGVGFQLAF